MDLTSLLSGFIGQQVVGAASKQFGINEEQAQSAVSVAIPLLLTALNKNAQNGGTEDISNALNQHDGSILDNLSSFLGKGGNEQDGLAIVGHIFGNNQKNVESAISKQSGLDIKQVTKILALVAPIVMGFLGKQKKSQELNSSGIGGLLSGLLNKGGSSSSKGINLGGFEKLLDQNGDGKIDASDVMGMIGGFFKKK